MKRRNRNKEYTSIFYRPFKQFVDVRVIEYKQDFYFVASIIMLLWREIRFSYSFCCWHFASLHVERKPHFSCIATSVKLNISISMAWKKILKYTPKLFLEFSNLSLGAELVSPQTAMEQQERVVQWPLLNLMEAHTLLKITQKLSRLFLQLPLLAAGLMEDFWGRLEIAQEALLIQRQRNMCP